MPASRNDMTMPLINHKTWKKPAPGATFKVVCKSCGGECELGFCETCPGHTVIETVWSAYVPAQVFIGEGKWNHDQREEDAFLKELDQ
jgi:DnaJ-class molecular chaperone